MRISNEPFIKEILGSKVKRKILSFLFSKQGVVSERELARVVGVSHTAVNKAMKQLLELNLVSAKTVGSALIWELNEKSLAYPYAEMLINSRTVSPLEIIKKNIFEYFDTIKAIKIFEEPNNTNRLPEIYEVYITGSVAEGTSNTESDIDILIVDNDPNNKDFRKLLEQNLGSRLSQETGNQVSFHIYDQKAIEKNEPAWLKSSIEKGIRVL